MVKYPSDNDATQNIEIIIIIKNIYEKIIFFDFLSELSEYLKSLVDKEIKNVYDPTCGRGNLLSVFGDEIKKYG